MRVTVSIDKESMQDLLQITDSRKKSQAISKAIERFLNQQKLAILLSMRGKLKLENNLKQLKEAELKKLAKLSRSG